MAAIIDILQELSRQRGRGEAGPLLASRVIEARSGERITHLTVGPRLERVWVELTGQPFRQHQSTALKALRRGEPLALVGGGASARQTMQLLAAEVLQQSPQASALLICRDAESARRYRQEFARLDEAFQRSFGVAFAGDGARAAIGARIVLTTPELLHERLLRHHDRAWQSLWATLRFVALLDSELYQGIAAAHLSALLLRLTRLAGAAPLLTATVAQVQGVAEVLQALTGHAWRLVAVDDGPRERLSVAYWRGGNERLRESATLALHLRREGLSVHLHCDSTETALLRPLVDGEQSAISIGPGDTNAQASIFVGYPASPASLYQALERGARTVVVVLGETPAERTLSRLVGRGGDGVPGLSDQPVTWLVPPNNAYVAAQHLLCAANERPLSEAEVRSWDATALIERLVQQQQLGRLPEAQVAWQPLPGATRDPYAQFDLRAPWSEIATLNDERGQYIDQIDPASYDRWGFPGATLPPLRSSYRVVGRDEELVQLTVRAEANQRRTLPLRRCGVQPRDERSQRSLRGRTIGYGRVLIEEEVIGYREATPNSAPAERSLPQPLATSWSAPALWITLPGELPSQGQLVGWTLAAALPLRTLSTMSDLVPAYDPRERRVYLVEAQAGGNGVVAWLYEHLEELLPLAYDIALDCRNDPLLEPVARADMDWLLSLLGGDLAVPRPTLREVPVPVREQRGVPPVAPSSPPRRESEPPLRSERSAPVNQPEAPKRVERPDEPVVPPAPPPIERSAEPPLRVEPAAPALPPVAPAPAPAPPHRVEPEQLPPRPPERPAKPATKRTNGAARRSNRRGEPARQFGFLPPPPKPVAVEPPVRPAPASKQPPPEPTTRGVPPQKSPPEEAAKPFVRSQRGQPAPAPSPPPVQASPPTPAPSPEPLPDASAMVERLRRLREQREANQPQQIAAPIRVASEPIEARFARGDQVFCVPYGQGEVRTSRVEGDKELLTVYFADHGELIIDPSVSAVRKLEENSDEIRENSDLD